MDTLDTLIIGAGVIGLACAATLARAGRDVLIVEAKDRFGSATSARNSEVMHAGLYYPTGSLRARLCVRGRALLQHFCDAHGVPHRRCGKLVVAQSDAETERLRQLLAQGHANGVTDLRWLDGAQARALEPALRCQAALLSPSTGILDSHALMLALLAQAENHGATLVLRTPVEGGQVQPAGDWIVRLGGAMPCTVRVRQIVNAAGLHACQMARALGVDARHIPAAFYAQGAYFSLSGRAPFSHLIYPVPGQSSHLGVHLTLDLAGQARFGPSFRWVDQIDYAIDPQDGAHFETAVRQYWPDLPSGHLQPAYAGVRPKISGPGEPTADFRIDGPDQHGQPGLVNLLGIESPGLTSCLAIAEHVAGLLVGAASGAG
ncbi:FAD-dependent oxidoreductase [Vitreoscilla filiformis]|uniref:FAD-dependent oxidoreductase n=1 Tax=Vitreoscilla filiformis TaxID=63 RepID=A0A221KHE8_VITFI|nr:NAD(P)/FAD-dependent oxidoreductase [Vitreoscilla filiformis]ASM78436.1 FAD-dependent oxidoreductase [Vitreoscilla filiformis]